MKKKQNVLILGNGRIGRAARYYLRKSVSSVNAAFVSDESRIKGCSFLIGALAGDLGERCLSLALRYKKNLIDVSDVDPPVYFKAKREIERAGITVIPGCGFSPGIVNFILGYELFNDKAINGIEVKAGTLSPRKSYYPFLWCFEDLVLGHRLSSRQVIAGKITKVAPFSGYREENIEGIPAESYYCASGFENLLRKFSVQNFHYRVIRPYGFRDFFSFLSNQGFLSKKHALLTKSIVEKRVEDNLTLSEITLRSFSQKTEWHIKSFSRKTEKLNSMQKITALPLAIIARLMLENKISQKGLVFMEDLGKDSLLFDLFIKGLRSEGVSLSRRKVK